jgi:hypothetical protein
MTYGELKRRIKSLGFEEDSTMTEYNEIVVDSIERAMQYIYDSTVKILFPYYERELGERPARPEHITIDTEDDYIIDLPDDLVELIPLLAAYHIWLDDDLTKATMYYNNFVQKRDAIIMANQSTVTAIIMDGGVRW